MAYDLGIQSGIELADSRSVLAIHSSPRPLSCRFLLETDNVEQVYVRSSFPTASFWIPARSHLQVRQKLCCQPHSDEERKQIAAWIDVCKRRGNAECSLTIDDNAHLRLLNKQVHDGISGSQCPQNSRHLPTVTSEYIDLATLFAK